MTTLKTANNRLLRLADKLSGKGVYSEQGPVPTRKFQLDSWWAKSRDKSCNSIYFEEFNPNECKTAACALGWAITDPYFRRAGLRLVENQSDTIEGHYEVFRITEDDFENLFTVYGYGSIYRDPTPRDVAKKIRQFVKERTEKQSEGETSK